MPFPTTPVLDNFNRPDSASLGSNWSTPVYPGVQSPRIVSNQMGGFDDGAGFSDAWWNVSTFGPEYEVYVTVGTRGTADLDLYARIESGGTASVDAYDLYITGTTWQWYILVDSVGSAIGGSASQAVSSGDSIGARCIGTTLTGYYKPSGGSWSEILSVVNGTLTGAGYIGLSANRNNVRLDDFGGGTYVAPGFNPSQSPPTIHGRGAA